MARLFDDASSQFLEINVAPVTGTPLTMAAWFRPDNANLFQIIVSIVDKDTADDQFRLVTAGNAVGDPVQFAVRTSSGTFTAVTTTGYSLNTWHHAVGVAASATDRRVFIDGGSKGVSTSSKIPSGLNRISIGRLGDSTPSNHFSGRIAEVVIWNVALTDVEVAVLAGGVSPLRVRPGNLKGYWPIFGASPETDFSGQGNNLTVTGATIADHAPVAPQFGFAGMEFGAAAVAASVPDLVSMMSGGAPVTTLPSPMVIAY